MRFDRRADIFFSACALEAVILFWLWVLSLNRVFYRAGLGRTFRARNSSICR